MSYRLCGIGTTVSEEGENVIGRFNEKYDNEQEVWQQVKQHLLNGIVELKIYNNNTMIAKPKPTPTRSKGKM